MMNPLHSNQPAPLNAPCMHAGGWEKLGWQRAEADGEPDHSSVGALPDDDEADRGLYS